MHNLISLQIKRNILEKNAAKLLFKSDGTKEHFWQLDQKQADRSI